MWTSIAMILLAGVMLGLFFNKSENSIWVNNAYDSKFTIDLKHNKILVTGSTYKFDTKNTIDELFSTVKSQYSNSTLKDDKMTIYKDNHYYIIKLVESKEKTHIYELSAEYIMAKDSNLDKYYHIPFPVDVVDDIRIEGTEFPVHCDFDYLKNYYKDFTNVAIEDSKIAIDIYGKVTLNFNNGHVVVEISK